MTRAHRAAAAAVTALVLVACGGDTDDSTDAQERPQEIGNGPTDTPEPDDDQLETSAPATPGQDGQAPDPPAGAVRLDPPDDEIGADLALEPVVFRGNDVVVALTGMTVYSTGAEVRLAVRRPPDAGGGMVTGGGPLGLDPGGPDIDPDIEPPDELLTVSFVYPDGRTASSLDLAAGPGPGPGEPLEGPRLSRNLSSGSDVAYDYHLWLWPLPEQRDGALRMEVEWPQEGIDSASTELDVADLRDAADRTVRLWGRGD